FRDRYLQPNVAGRWFVARYYEVSPAVADYIRQHSALKPLVRAMLAPLVVVALFLLGSGAAAKGGIGALLAALVVARRRRRSLGARAQGAGT
ncbi:MAG TPA: CFI-box-CTERM domain-containing protein, partial [Gammaproteobacteria bacterium]|nr:CFI-box-CTERM domain-containing protein [Gammaproteobacteria bacterium]